ncbi:MAG: hypothetical protein E7374_01340 [Clostridiales bacterium]|nr:hypothetical protein [Clostridiales bacterium]
MSGILKLQTNMYSSLLDCSYVSRKDLFFELPKGLSLKRAIKQLIEFLNENLLGVEEHICWNNVVKMIESELGFCETCEYNYLNEPEDKAVIEFYRGDWTAFAHSKDYEDVSRVVELDHIFSQGNTFQAYVTKHEKTLIKENVLYNDNEEGLIR